jgi:aryl-alcohol dehydrogenase
MRTEAAVSRKGRLHPEIEVVELEEPREGEILVRIVACGVCHTDLSVHAERGPWPIILGHEGAGVVEGIGEGVGGFAEGDRVLLSAAPHCGVCSSCRRGAYPYCLHARALNFRGRRPDGTTGVSQDGAPIHAHFFGQSSFARHALAQARSAVRLPTDPPLEVLAPLGCGVPTGAGSVLFALGLRAGQSIAVFGTGSVGLSAIMAARLAGAVRIVAVDVVPSRLALARELGATDAVDARTEDPVEAVRDATGGGADVTFNTTRSPKAYDQMLASLAVQGTAGFVGPPREGWAPDLGAMMLGGQSVMGIVQGGVAADVIVPMLIDLHRQGRFPLELLIREYPFERIGDAFADSEEGTTVKPVLRMAAREGEDPAPR